MTTWLPLFAWLAAFWVAVLCFDRECDRGLRFVFGWALGAGFAHAGWALLHWSVVRANPAALFDPTGGFCVLFLPLGLLSAGSAALATLPLSLSVARLGCLAAGCCGGVSTAWGAHPVALYEMAGLLALHCASRLLPRCWLPAAVLGGFGLLRVGLEPLRAPPPLGDPALPPRALAAAWVAVGATLAVRTFWRRRVLQR
jgi:hypothetical protein